MALYHRDTGKRVEGGREIQDKMMTDDDCAALCTNDDKCASFDFCEGDKLDSGEYEHACYLHEDHPVVNPDKPLWDLDSFCDHYTCKFFFQIIKRLKQMLNQIYLFLKKYKQISIHVNLMSTSRPN